MDALEIAQRSTQTMWSKDVASPHVGMQIDEVAPGFAKMSMDVADYMLNGAKICHGGYIFMLADSCFAFACNTHNDMTLAQGCNIDFIRPAMLGDTLVAEAVELSRGRKTGVYDITVSNQDGKLIAAMRGKSYASGKPMLEAESE